MARRKCCSRGKSDSWVVPNGGRSNKLKDKDAAAREGGVTGKMKSRSVGEFTHRKRNGDGKKVKVFRLDVHREPRRWPEKKQRKRRWTGAHAAFLTSPKPLYRQHLSRTALAVTPTQVSFPPDSGRGRSETCAC
jgi:hypothetical protein